MYKILVPYNFDELSKKALTQAEMIASKKGGKVSVIHVMETGGTSSFSAEAAPTEDNAKDIALVRFMEKLKERIDKEVNGILRPEYMGQVMIKVAEFEKTVADVILDQDTDLMITGADSFHESEHILSSSLAQTLAEKSKQPVMVVTPKSKLSNCNHVVYASNFDETHTHELMQLAEFLKGMKSDIDFVKVSNKVENADVLRTKMKDIARSIQFDNAGAEAQIVRSNDFNEAIELYIDKEQADLLTLNLHGFGGFTNFFHETRVEKSVNHLETPVMLLNIQ